ncbi:MAG: Bifunctional phosphoglucose/phosphomannose isomerase [Candidatus Magasanikbacteria bacterium GW2011_GWA2_45_39]|uniref:Bifunctional phosphoglucose/phosphomannose isomerase n=1 Tax=Candidatus Magasanikbacteria bacterium GW2011_GWA2_45_39 TaxID=1619041 RepID=A0A0G1QDR4_9BACT|nr:MAG: Bifunctional phosphoglucose/phosphomannose isomerase [Candidatus Magasanikbacteria bacterium GW2011_GWA2_45_39]
MYQSIKTFAEQFAYTPKIENKNNLKKFKRFVLIGMGGSGLPGKLLKTWKPEIPLVIHQNYGLPPLSESELKQSLIICCSHSGSTEEVLNGFDAARAKKLPLAVIATGKALLERAQKYNVPHVVIPQTGAQPRMSTGLMLQALVGLMSDTASLKELHTLVSALKPASYEKASTTLAQTLKNHVPIIYASEQNGVIALNWKIKFNETGKSPAFWHVLPELNHNEMTGFDHVPSTRALSQNFHFVFLEDATDHPRIHTRMRVTATLYKKRGFPCTVVRLKKSSRIHTIFAATILADWTAYHLAKIYGVNPQEVPMVEEFKKLIKR